MSLLLFPIISDADIFNQAIRNLLSRVRVGNNGQSSDSGVRVTSQQQCCPEGITLSLLGGGQVQILCIKGKLHVHGIFYWSETTYDRAKILTGNDAADICSLDVISRIFFKSY